MKKIINLLIVASLALAGAVMAQQPTPSEEQSPGKKPSQEKKAPAEVKQTQTRAPKTETPVVKPKTEAPAVKESTATESPAAIKPEKNTPKTRKAPATVPETRTSTEPAMSATPTEKKEKSSRSKDMKSPAANAMTSPSTSPATATTSATPATTNKKSATTKTIATPATATTSATPAASAAATTPANTTPPTTTASTTPTTTTASATPTTTTASATPAAATTASASAAPSVSSSTAASTNTTATKPKPAPQQIQQIKQQHMSFRAEPRPDRVPPVTFSANFRLPGSEQWQGPQYEVYRSYHPERHDRGWYSSHSQRVELIAGGYYYFNNGYWYPAWGYDPGHEYYAYDAPIYVGKRSDPPDKVIADVQAALQEMGYYRGEVDGLIGPLTREALTKYQADNGMTVTAVIDEPTLDSLGMG